MMARAIVGLSVLLVLQVAVLAVRGWSGGTSQARHEAGTLVQLEPARVARVVVKDREGRTLELVREGEGFVVATAAGYPVEGDRVQRLLEDLKQLRLEGVVATNPANHRALGVAEGAAEREVTLFGPDGKELARVLLGKNGGAFARRAGEDTVYRVADTLGWRFSTAASAYIDTRLTDFQPDKAERVEWLDAEGKLTFALERVVPTATASSASGGEAAPPKAQWRIAAPAPAEPDSPAEAESIVRTLGSLYMVEPVDKEAKPEHGLSPPALRLQATLAGGEKVVVEIGAKTDDDNRYARVQGKPFVVKLSRYSAERLLEAPSKIKPRPPVPAPPVPTALPAPADEPADRSAGGGEPAAASAEQPSAPAAPGSAEPAAGPELPPAAPAGAPAPNRGSEGQQAGGGDGD
ncbi:MAG: hypothetical protein KatS3mg102_1762 [Planctomycetota bacterium]|nr:MAG: hypothetical protein KatS3mg102_1762 [Planctomycetota bacterium]